MRARIARWLRAWADRLDPLKWLHFHAGCHVERVWIDGKPFVPAAKPSDPLRLTLHADTEQFDTAMACAQVRLRAFVHDAKAAIRMSAKLRQPAAKKPVKSTKAKR